MDAYVQVGNHVSSVVKSAITVKKLCLLQQKSLTELTEQRESLEQKHHLLLTAFRKQRSSLQQKNHKLEEESRMLVEKNISLEKKLKKLEDLNKNYSHIIKDLSFNEDDDLTPPHTPENPNGQCRQRSSTVCTLKKEGQMLDNIVTPVKPVKRKKRQSTKTLRRSTRKK